MGYDGVIDLLLGAQWLLGCLLFATFLINLAKTCWPTPCHPHTNWGLRGRTPSGLPAQFLALPRSFDESPCLPNSLTKFYLTLLTLYFVGKQSRHLTGCAKEFYCLGSFDGNTRPRCMLVAAEPSRLHCRGHLSRALAVQNGVAKPRPGRQHM
jgi:hypothetical protein